MRHAIDLQLHPQVTWKAKFYHLRMHYASQGARNATRKGTNALLYHSGHNGPGGTTANTTSRSLHISSSLLGATRVLHPTAINSLESIRPRNPPHRLFSASKNVFQRFFTQLTTPGFRLPTYFAQAQHTSARSLHNAHLRGSSIQSGLSFAARASLKSNALQRRATMFLPRPPPLSPPRCGGVTQVGLGTARSFSTSRPIFQHLAENVPVSARALYEVDWHIEMEKEQARMHLTTSKKPKSIKKSKAMLQPTREVNKTLSRIAGESNEETALKQELDLYFPVADVAPVTSYLLIPLAPTPSLRMPLSLDLPPSAGPDEPTLLPPLSYLSSLHASHSTHALRVSTLFTRLDQANVWSRGGVSCSPYSQSLSRHRQTSKDEMEAEGVCTVLKLEFKGWTKAEVRGIIGESGTGWCALEEVWHNEVSKEDSSDEDSLSTDNSQSGSVSVGNLDYEDCEFVDPAQSLVLPTIDFSSSGFLSPASSSQISAEDIFASVPESDPWAEEYPYSSSSSDSDLSDLIIEAPSANGWFDPSYSLNNFSSRFADAVNSSELEAPEPMFY